MHPALTAAGHEGAQQGEGLFIKPSTQQEIDFYQWIFSRQSRLTEFSPQFMGTLVEKTPNQSESNSLQPFLVLEDLCVGFKEPAILDIKLGKILWDSFATPEKRERLLKVADSTTSGTLGFRIAGMSVIDSNGERVAYGKDFGREATMDTVTKHLETFWPAIDNDYVVDVCVAGIISKLEELHAALKTEHLEFHSASVLLIYEGDIQSLQTSMEQLLKEHGSNNDGTARKSPTSPHSKVDSHDQIGDDISDSGSETEPKILDVRLIDFAHTTKAEKPDDDTIDGLQNLITELKKIYEKHSS